ncbi:unnamed protein product [Menidia menidia]|uniref:(Atlantic silverside) hypothetical protein n=1 Tax=Menidia menidia TaxID=238744 RepID=A0A8S4A8V4_9TELE|nr:unnamed protein product [Menidia menidia]
MAETANSARRRFLDFSPVRENEANKENDAPVLSLIQFSKPPFVTFGTVKLGTTKSVVLQIENPTDDVEAEVTVDKCPSRKGFSVDHNTFTIQPEGSFSLTVTWTPVEEGGIRELIIFNANGVLKHQAILLGRAEGPKKKKKSLWDTIKNKRDMEKISAPRKKKTQCPLKMSANKTFQVSQKPHYKRDKPRSPLASINDGKYARQRCLTKNGTTDIYCSKVEDQRASHSKRRHQPQALPKQEMIHTFQVKSPVVLVVPGAELMDYGNISASQNTLAEKPENKDLTRMLNRTLSPIGTPESFKRLMPHIESESPLSASVKSAGEEAPRVSAGSPVLSLKDALALIDSDLSVINSSPCDRSSSCEFSDSLESKSVHDCGPDTNPLRALPDSPAPPDSNEQRLTFFVSKKTVVSGDDEVKEKVKKASFTSATVIKNKAPTETNTSSGRKVKKSRRRLLEKTLELSEGRSQCDSPPDTPELPVIELETGKTLCDEMPGVPEFTSSSPARRPSTSPASVTFPVSSPPCLALSHFSFSVTSLPSSVPAPTTFNITPPLSVGSAPSIPEQSPTPSIQEELFPVHVAGKANKRKSEEFLKCGGKIDVAEKPEQVKRSRVVVGKTEPPRSVQERRIASQRPRAAGSAHSVTSSSLRTRRSVVPAKMKQPNPKVVSKGASSLGAFGAPSVKMSKLVAVAQSKLAFIKPNQTAIPRHPMPFAAKNMFYDERWIEKQERGFTWWINYVLTPDDFKVNTEVAKVNAVSLAMGTDNKFSVPKAPTKEEMSFSTYTARRKLNRLRRSACQLFASETLVKAIQRLELEVEARRLLVRKDRHLWKDIGERKKVLNWLLSYNPLWLRIGLETIFGELISLESNSDALGLALFILQRLLWNPDIAAEFRHPRVPNLYKDGHEEALSRFTLKKLLLLVCFLDKAKESRLIEHDPCLFCVDAEFKASKDLLLAFSRDFLSGEGILPRHLAYLGLPVSHVQMPLDEFDFAVKNLAVDLKCGIRLVRVMELMVQDWSLSAKLRLPAISRLQKVHNVDIALQMLQSKGIDLKDEHGAVIDSRDIVDGHREKTLSLLWKIIFAFHVEVVLDEDQLREEIGFLTKTLTTKRRLASLRADRRVQPSPSESRLPYEHTSTRISLLMDWARAVCGFYNLKVENFTVAFSDGRVLCYLIHHYHPGLLPEASISHSTTQTVECSPRGRLELSCSASDSDSSFDSFPSGLKEPNSPSLEFKELLENEKNNFRHVNSAVAFLGGVPAMINLADMSNTIPNEKERNKAAAKIQVLVRSFLQKQRAKGQIKAAIVIQSVWRGYLARNRLRLKKAAEIRAMQNKAATLIQVQWRMLSASRAYQRLRYYTIVVQAQWRMRKAATAYGKIYRAASVIQKYLRAWALSKKEQERYLLLRTAVVKIQRTYRRRKTLRTQRENNAAKVIQGAFRKWYKKKLAERNVAALRIQSWFRMQFCLRQYRKIKRSTVLIQALCRGRRQRLRFQMLKLQHRSAAVIQSAFRGHVVRKCMARQRFAAITIQRRFRASVKRDAQRKMFVRLRHAAVTIQAAYRGKVTRDLLKEQCKAATTIQAAFRKHAAQREYFVLRNATSIIQKRYRAKLLARKTKKEYDALRNAALVLQANWRGRADRKKIEMWHRCATLVQTCYRRHKAQTEYRSQRAAAEVIQHYYRAFVAGKKMRSAYILKKAACITLQAGFRGMKVRKELRRKHQAATVIQSLVRMFLRRKKYFLLQSAAIIIQSQYRAVLLCRTQQNEFRQLKQATITIQAVFRGLKVRRDLKMKHDAARTIQAQFRRHRCHMAYLATRYAAIVIQQRYRATKLRDEHVRGYRTIKSAAVVIQAAYRGNRARRRIAEMHQAAKVIQRKFLTMQARKQFLAIKAATLTCQHKYRALTLARKHHLDYLLQRRAVVCLQAAYRGYAVRKQLRIRQMAAVTIQCHFRMYQQRTYYTKLRWACCVLQQRYRAKRIMKAEMHALTSKRKAAVVLQAAFRSMKSRQMIKHRHQAASIIQRAYRTHCQHRSYLTLRSSVFKIQRRYRAKAAMLKQRRLYENSRRAAVLLQAAHRGQQVRRTVARWHQAATVIQSAFRRHREEVKFQAMCLSAIIIQRRFRALLLQRRDRAKFLRLRRSVVVIQAAIRGHRLRTNMAKMHRAAAIIQANFKGHKQHKAFRRQRWAACVLQQRFRAHRQKCLQAKYYQELREAAVVLQAAYRGMRSRQMTERRHQAARVIQRAFGAHREHKMHLAVKASVLTIQRRYRASLMAKKQMQRYQEMRNAAVFLQAAYRGQQVRRTVARWHQAATVIQSAFRRHREEVKFQAMRLSAIIIQKRFRALLLQKRDREKFLRLKRSVVVIQAAVRGHRLRTNMAKMHRAAAIIQANFKGHKQQEAFRRQRWAACVLQQRFRAHRQKCHQAKYYQELRKAAVVLQAAYRGMRSRQMTKRRHQAAIVIQRAFGAHREHEMYLAVKASVLTIQRRYRASLMAKKQMQRYQEMRNAAVVLQAAYRGQQIRRTVARWHQAATVIQSAFKRHREEVKFQAMRLSAIIIQRRFRALLLQKRDRAKFLRLKRSVVVIQAAVRGHRIRTNMAKMHRAAAIIQANFKGHKQKEAFRRQRWAACVLQQRFRAHRQKCLQAKYYQELRKAAVVLQAAYRGMKSRQMTKRRHQAAIVIQRAFGAHQKRQQFLKLRSSAVTIQRKHRATVAAKAERGNFIQRRQAAIMLQRHCRAWRSRKQAYESARAERRLRFTSAVFHHLSAIKIQRALRAHWALESAKRQIHSVISIQRCVRAKQQRRRYVEDRRKVITAQRAVRCWLARRHRAASVIQLAVRKFLLLKRQEKVEKGIVKAQALWRGHHSRRLNDNPKLMKLRQRLHQVSARVREEDRLCNKTSSALDYLLRYKHFSYILEALKNLETATRLSPECCERLVESGATHVIFTLIRCCNRSVACMEVITFSIQILLNLSKYHMTIEAVYSVNNSVETLLDLLQRYREKAGDKVAEKGGSIFTKTCFLLALLLQDKQRAEEVSKLPKALDRICSIYRLTVRKHQMDAERTIVKQKMNASVNGSFYVPATPRKSRPVQKFAPDWVLRKDKLKDIVDPLRAIQMVADTLSIVL